MTDAARAVPREEPRAAPAPVARRTLEPWPLTWRDGGLLLAASLALTAAWVGIGELLTGPLRGSAIVEFDRDVAEWFVARRTESRNAWADAGAMLADTFVKIVVTALIAGVMLAVWRRWREPLLVAVSLIVEASVFITVTWIVGRPRPDVRRLEDSPVASSFPSGHTAAAAAYAAVAIVVFRHTRNVWIRAAVVVVLAVIPIAVGVARTYAGMHYVTDVVAGALLGYASVVVVWAIIGRDPS